MLVISAKEGEKVTVGKDITLCVLEVMGTRVKLGIDAPASREIRRLGSEKAQGADQKAAGTSQSPSDKERPN